MACPTLAFAFALATSMRLTQFGMVEGGGSTAARALRRVGFGRGRLAPRPLRLLSSNVVAGGGGEGGEGDGADKELILVRHGETEMNAFLHRKPYKSFGFKDPGYYDTVLNAAGVAQAKALNQRLRRSLPRDEVDLIVVSPLTRTLQTASHAFDGYDCPRLVAPHVREKLWLSSDVGSHPSRLAETFPAYDFDHLEEFWWYRGHDDGDGHGDGALEDWQLVREEPNHVFVDRLEEFRRHVRARPERRIAVVAHWGVLYAMTGLDFRNCEAKRIKLSELREKFRFEA